MACVNHQPGANIAQESTLIQFPKNETCVTTLVWTLPCVAANDGEVSTVHGHAL